MIFIYVEPILFIWQSQIDLYVLCDGVMIQSFDEDLFYLHVAVNIMIGVHIKVGGFILSKLSYQNDMVNDTTDILLFLRVHAYARTRISVFIY